MFEQVTLGSAQSNRNISVRLLTSLLSATLKPQCPLRDILCPRVFVPLLSARMSFPPILSHMSCSSPPRLIPRHHACTSVLSLPELPSASLSSSMLRSPPGQRLVTVAFPPPSTVPALLPFSYFPYILLIDWLAVLSLCCCTGCSLVAASGGYSLVMMHGLLTEVGSLGAEHRS